MGIFDTATVLALVASVLIPALSSLLAKQQWPSVVVALLTLLIASVNGFVTEWAAHPHDYDWKHGALTALGSYIVAAIARAQYLRGTQLDAKLRAVGSH